MALAQQSLTRFLVTVLVFVALTTPSRLHSSLIELPGPTADSAVAVDARHAEQRAHFEHSEIELLSPCPACLLTNRSQATFLLSAGQDPRPPRITRISLLTSDWSIKSLSPSAPSRAPPLP